MVERCDSVIEPSSIPARKETMHSSKTFAKRILSPGRLVMVGLAVLGALAARPTMAQQGIPESLSPEDWAGIQAARDVTGQEAYLKASNTGSSDRFGVTLEISGNTIVVGAIKEDSSATRVNGDQSEWCDGFRRGLRVRARGGRGHVYVVLRDGRQYDDRRLHGGAAGLSGRYVQRFCGGLRIG